MATYTNPTSLTDSTNRAYQYQVLIDISEDNDLTGGIFLSDFKLRGIITPASWTTADITFQGSSDDSTYNVIYNRTGSIYTVYAGASRYILIPVADTYLFPPYIKVGTTAGQAADRTLILILER